MKNITITKSESDQRIDKYLKKHYPKLPSALIYKYLRLKRIKVNKKKVDISYKIQENDLLELYINDELLESKPAFYDFFNAGNALNILYEDDNIILIDKPAGILCHPDDQEYIDTIIGRAKKYLYNKSQYNPADEFDFTPTLCNRIDRNTGGIVILAKNSLALRFINSKIKSREVDKFYLCTVHGTPKKHEDILNAFLFKDAKKNMVFIQDKKTPENLSISTQYKVLATKNNLSLLEIKLLTGRTHQIRAQMAHIGYPLLGDGKYGVNINDRKAGFTHQALYSYKLVFNFKELEKQYSCFEYLNNKAFNVKEVWFAKQLFNYN